MKELKDWVTRGFDLTYDGVNQLTESDKNKLLYPLLEVGFKYDLRNVDKANSCEGMIKRIKAVDDAILSAHNFNLIN